MTTPRDRILGRVRKALGRDAPSQGAMADAEAYIAAHRRGPQPTLPTRQEERAARIDLFTRQARRMATTVEPLADRREIPAAVARYLDGLELPPLLAEQRSTRGVCWLEFADLDWAGAGLSIEPRPTRGEDRTGITGCFCAIAETGTLVFASGADTPTGTTLLPDTHVAVLAADRIVATMEDAFALIRSERGSLPRAVNLISGPSRTGDIEQTIVLGAHGPYRVHVLLVG
jgi:L-lactate dehydrogenase complex protein LldG